MPGALQSRRQLAVNSQPTESYRPLQDRHLDDLLQERTKLSSSERREIRAVAAVYPFRTNKYVNDELIDWSSIPDDPIYRLTFPQPGMLSATHLAEMVDLIDAEAPAREINAAATRIRTQLNPHPAGQADQNTPVLDGVRLEGFQHKYAETMLVFPRQGQTCHAYCTYCFRWPQFVNDASLKMATDDIAGMRAYLESHPEISSVLITGGDSLIMRSSVLRRYVEPLLSIPSVESVRLGTKALTYWPYRVLTDPDADDLLNLFREVVASGRQLAVMAHYSHPRELMPAAARQAITRIRETGAVIRSQAPLIRQVNDDVHAWSELWRDLNRLSVVPYYMFVERDTGAQHYFAVPLARAHKIFRDAYAQVSGLARTARGPVMSATPGKVCVDGIAEIAGEQVFVLRMLQARDPELVGRPFFARYDPTATWLDELEPALGSERMLPNVFPAVPASR